MGPVRSHLSGCFFALQTTVKWLTSSQLSIFSITLGKHIKSNYLASCATSKEKLFGLREPAQD